MKFLLDTHLLLWWVSNSPLLPAQARELIGSPDNAIFVSAVSVWAKCSALVGEWFTLWALSTAPSQSRLSVGCRYRFGYRLDV